ncbi:MAG: cytosine permease, partial [Silvibacterium sp.]
PWRLMASFHNYIFGWLVGYSALLGPVAAIMIADYFLIRRTRLDMESLYRRGGVYEYRNGINPRAMIALVAGVVCALTGRFLPVLHWLFDYAWFTGFFVSGAVYLGLMWVCGAAMGGSQGEE